MEKFIERPVAHHTRFKFFYGWVIVGAAMTILIIHAGTVYSFGVFFKPLAAEFGWGRGATSGVFATFSILQGAFGVVLGWLTDRFGPSKVMVFCGVMAGLGLVLSGQVSTLWQLHLTYGVIASLGLAGPFAISVSTTARWFQKRRGLALGLVSSGIGLGTLIVVPVVERLIASFGWSTAFILLGSTCCAVMIGGALCLRKDPKSVGLVPYGATVSMRAFPSDRRQAPEPVDSSADMLLAGAIRTRPLWTLLVIYFLFNFCLQMIMVHLVNYATDLGISSLIAATFISVIGIGSISGRIVMGAFSDRIGSHNALFICCAILAGTLILLIFSNELWMFYLFAIVFGFAYGGEVPQMAALVGSFFGLHAVTVLVGIITMSARLGGALGSYLGGGIFDATQSYRMAFSIAALAGLIAVAASMAVRNYVGMIKNEKIR